MAVNTRNSHIRVYSSESIKFVYPCLRQWMYVVSISVATALNARSWYIRDYGSEYT